MKHKIWAVIPVKQFALAKGRLAPVLDADERATLARLMLEDVLDVMSSSRDVLAGTIVVTSDPDAAACAKRNGAMVVFDHADNGINAAVHFAIEHVAGADEGLVVVPSDIPHITPGAIVAAARAILPMRTMAIAASDDRGTNLLACRPAGATPLHFGRGSFDLHCRLAAQAGITVHELRLPELSLDLDRPQDLRSFLSLESRTRTHEFLSRPGIRARVEFIGEGREAAGLAVAGASR